MYIVYDRTTLIILSITPDIRKDGITLHFDLKQGKV